MTGNSSQVDSYTIIGARTTLTGASTTSVAGAAPRAYWPQLGSTSQIGYGTYVTKLYKVTGTLATPPAPVLTPISAFGLFQGFGGTYSATGNLSSGAQTVSLWPISIGGGNWPVTDLTIVNQVNQNFAGITNVGLANPDGGILVCLHSSGSAGQGQNASVSLGQSSGNLTTNVTVGDSRCPS